MNRYLTIIESPYAASNGRTVEDNLEYARACCRDSYDRGEVPFASHLFFTQFMDDQNQVERKEGIHYGLMIGKALAERVVFYTDNGWSNGMRDAAKFWDGIGIEVIVRHLGERIKEGEHEG